jgi:hypothetical protein
MKVFLSVMILMFGFLQLSAQIGPAAQPAQSEKAKKQSKIVKPTTPEGIAKATSESLTKTLGLTATQKAAIYKAVFAYERDLVQLKSSKISSKAQYTKTQELDRVKTKKFQTIMSKAQYNDYLMSFP